MLFVVIYQFSDDYSRSKESKYGTYRRLIFQKNILNPVISLFMVNRTDGLAVIARSWSEKCAVLFP